MTKQTIVVVEVVMVVMQGRWMVLLSHQMATQLMGGQRSWLRFRCYTFALK